MMKATFYSNFIEILSEKLKENVFFNSLKYETYIFVRNNQMKNWLMKSFCQDSKIGVAFDIKFINTSNFLNFIQNLAAIKQEKRFLNFLELNLLIRKKIKEYLEISDSKNELLKKYLLKNQKANDTRLLQLTDELTRVFIRYAIHGSYENLNEIKKTSFQAKLFYDLYFDEGFSLAFRDLSKIKKNIFKDISFHFFDINYLPPLFFDFISDLENVYHYISSPCMYFWEDLTSDFEKQRLQRYWKKNKVSCKKIAELDSYLRQRNSFLANMEKVKKSYLHTINNYESYEIFENYLDDTNENSSNSILKILQRDILHLENRDEMNLAEINSDDKSLQIHIANSKFREIQILYSNILKLLDGNKDISPSDIQVIASNIDEYSPYIHMIFNNNDMGINYKISDLKLVNSSQLINGILVFFNLTKNRWNRTDILELLSNPLFQKKQKFSNEEIDLLSQLIEKANIDWGLDEEHIKKHCKNNKYLESLFQRSWSQGLKRMVISLVFMLNEIYLDKNFQYELPIELLDMSSSIMLNKFFKVIFSVNEDLKFIEEKNDYTLTQWSIFLRKIIHEYFAVNDSYNESSVFEAYMSFISDLEKISFRFRKEKFSFGVIFTNLKNHLSRSKFYFNKNNEQAIHFSSFEISSIPSKVKFMIGLDDEAIGFAPQSSLEIVLSKDVPTDNELKKSMFLESILNTRKYLILSYSSSLSSLEDASILLQALISYLEKSYKMETQQLTNYIVKKHPSFAFHKSYFEKKKNQNAYSDYIAAKYYYLDIKKEKSLSNVSKEMKFFEALDIKSLKLLSKNPIKFYLNKSLEIYLREDKKTNEFSISPLDMHIIKHDSFKNELNSILSTYEKKSKMPKGIFYDIEKRKIINATTDLHETLLEMEIEAAKLMTIELSNESRRNSHIDEKTLQIPAIEVQKEDKSTKIIGKITHISNKGLLIEGRDNLTTIVRNWPEILIYLSLDHQFPKQIVFILSKKIKTFHIADPIGELSKYFDYYLEALKSPSFLMKPFIESILENNEKNLSNEIKKVFTAQAFGVEPYTKWFFENYKIPNPSEIIKKHSIEFQDLFKTILEVN